MRNATWIALSLSATALAACDTGQVIVPFNELPVADAKVLKDGKPIEQMRDGSLADLIFPYSGMPVTITLDGNSSYDPDGKIAGYRWLSASRTPDAGLPPPWTPDAGTPMPFWRKPPPMGSLTDAAPTVTVGAGLWAFSLWVIDDRGEWSNPDTIRFYVGDPPLPPSDAGTGDGGARDGGIPDVGVPTDGAGMDAVVVVDAEAPADANGDATNGSNGDAANGGDAAPDATP